MAEKKPVRTARLNQEFPTVFQGFLDHGLTFSIGVGKYSHWIDFPDERIKFIMRNQSRKTFIGTGMLKRDFKRESASVILSDLEDNVKESDNIYFSVGTFLNFHHKELWCVDLNSAYLQCLFNLGLITPKTSYWISKHLTKQERLVAVGMLAKQKHIYSFSEGKQVGDPDIDADKYRFVFNAVIQETNAILEKAARIAGDDYIFYWVDGIYLKDEWSALLIAELFRDNGFPCKIEYLTNFESQNHLKHMQFTFYKDGEKKMHNIPVDEVTKDIRSNLKLALNQNQMVSRHGSLDAQAILDAYKTRSQLDIFGNEQPIYG